MSVKIIEFFEKEVDFFFDCLKLLEFISSLSKNESKFREKGIIFICKEYNKNFKTDLEVCQIKHRILEFMEEAKSLIEKYA